MAEINAPAMQENKMGVMPVKKLLINMSLPMMISMLVQALYNIVDSVFVSRISENALTAVSLAFPLQTLMIAVAAGTGVGVNALCSRALGEKNPEKATATAMNGIFIYILSYLVMLAAGLLLVKPFYTLQTKGADPEIFQHGVTYLSIVMTLSFGIYAQFIFERILQSTGRTVLTMISQATGAVINIILDPILIFGKFGLPELGIAGAAYATVIGQIIAAILAFIFNMKLNKEIRLSVKKFRPDKKIIGEIYKIGVPSICMQAIGSVMTAGMNLILMGLSSTAAAIFGVYFKLQSFFFMPVIGMNNGMIPIISFNYGARNKARMLDTLKFAYFLAACFMLLGLAAFEILPKQLLSIFGATEAMYAIGVPALRIIGIHFLAAWFCIMTGSFFQCVGRAMYSLYVSVARQLVVLLPVAWLLSRIGGLDLIWWCLPIAEVMSVCITLVCRRKVFKEIIDPME